jgi:hypothetical protein
MMLVLHNHTVIEATAAIAAADRRLSCFQINLIVVCNSPTLLCHHCQLLLFLLPLPLRHNSLKTR